MVKDTQQQMHTPQKAPPEEGTNDEASQYDFIHRAMNAFRTPSSKTAQHTASTPTTVALTPGTPNSTSSHHREGSDEGYLGEHEEYRIRKLFREELHHKSDKFLVQPPSFSNRRSRRLSSRASTSFDSDCGIVSRRKSFRSRSLRSPSFDSTPVMSSSTDMTSSDSSPDRPERRKRFGAVPTLYEEDKKRLSQIPRLLLFLGGMVLFSMTFMCWTNHTMDDELLVQYERTIRHAQRKHRGSSTAGLRGKLVRMAGKDPRQLLTPMDNDFYHSETKKPTKGATKTKKKRSASVKEPKEAKNVAVVAPSLKFSRPPPLNHGRDDFSFAVQDEAMYLSKTTDLAQQRIFFFGGESSHTVKKRASLDAYPADWTDSTQDYGIYDSDDEHLSHMEMRQPLEQGDCVPMQKWQTTYHPSCNAMHELGMDQLGDESTGDNFELFGTKGFWRNAWRMDSLGGSSFLSGRESVVVKTLKYQHSFEDAHFEHDRVDAVAMERLTSSPHVINIFGFCGHSVMTEFANGSRVGELADKSKKKPLARLKIARDIANGLADVHGIDGDGNATFVHLDINPANVVSIGGTLKLNDFNIGILLRWNTTSNTQCGFPAQYPNPQWRSPEEARNEQNLTEKVDVFSMGHIFFRLICGHEPWNKLEKGGKPTKEDIHEKVQKGILPHIPNEVLTSTDKEVAAIRDAMIACYAFDPKERPSARQISSILQDTLEALEQEVGIEPV